MVHYLHAEMSEDNSFAQSLQGEHCERDQLEENAYFLAPDSASDVSVVSVCSAYDLYCFNELFSLLTVRYLQTHYNITVAIRS